MDSASLRYAVSPGFTRVASNPNRSSSPSYIIPSPSSCIWCAGRSDPFTPPFALDSTSSSGGCRFLPSFLPFLAASFGTGRRLFPAMMGPSTAHSSSISGLTHALLSHIRLAGWKLPASSSCSSFCRCHRPPCATVANAFQHHPCYSLHLRLRRLAEEKAGC